MCPNSSTTKIAVSWSMAWFKVTITPLFINDLIKSDDLMDNSLARSDTTMVSGIFTSFWINSWGFSNFWTFSKFFSRNFSPSCSLWSSLELSLNVFLSFFKFWGIFFWGSCLVFLTTFVFASDFFFSSSADSFWAFNLFLSASSKSIDPVKSCFTFDFFSLSGELILVTDKFGFAVFWEGLLKEIVFLLSFLLSLMNFKSTFLSSVLTISFSDLWESPAAFIWANKLSKSIFIALESCLTFISAII